MLNIRMKKIQVICFILTIVLLAALNKFVMNVNTNMYSMNTSELVNHEHVSSQKLFDNVWQTVKNNYYDPTMNHQSWSRWKEHYHGKIKTDEDAKVAIDTMLASLDDPYSKYMDKEEYNEQNSSIDSKITGIGVNIASISGKVHIINVLDGTPAQAANLQSGDIILDIDGKTVNGLPLSDVAALVKGPENTFVQITILRNKDKFIKKVMRKEIKIKTVKSSMDKNIGYIQIVSFSEDTAQEFMDAYTDLQNQGMQGLVLDLRNNPGGLLGACVDIAKNLVPKGDIVSIVDKDGNKEVYSSDLEQVQYPVAVLINKNSASASEILSGAIQDTKSGVIIGETSYGKGSVQTILPMMDDDAVKLTIAKYYTPSGRSIDGVGITPDIEVKLDENSTVDTQLDKAKEVINQQINNQ